MAGAQFSAQWWNDEAKARGNRLTKSDIESLTGQKYDTIPQPGQPAASGTIIPWPTRVVNEAPGFKASGLLLSYSGSVTMPSGNVTTNPSGWANYPEHNYFVSPVGYVAPGANAPWTPTLTTTPPPPPTTPWYAPPAPLNPPPPPASPPGTTTLTPTSAPPTPTTIIPTTPGVGAPPGAKPGVLGPINAAPSAPANNAPPTIAPPLVATNAIAGGADGFAFAPNVPKWLVISGAALLLLIFLKAR